jgi:hypothetical protein
LVGEKYSETEIEHLKVVVNMNASTTDQIRSAFLWRLAGSA